MKLVDSNLNLGTTNLIKGISILLVVFSHLIQIGFIDFGFLNDRLLSAGAWGVSLFLLISGYGLTKSYEKSGIDGFFKKRLVSVMIPYVTVQVIVFICDAILLHKTYPGQIIIQTLFGVNWDIHNGPDQTMWFIPYILFWYVAFYLVFKYLIKPFSRAVVLFGIACFVMLIFKPFSGDFFQLILFNAFVFPLGIWIATITNFVPRIRLRTVLVLFVIIFALFLTIWISQPIQNEIINKYLGVYVFAPMFFVGAQIVQSKNLNIKTLGFIGTISFEIFLLEWIFMNQYNVLAITENKFLAVILYSIVLFTSALVLSKVFNVIRRIINIQNNKPIVNSL